MAREPSKLLCTSFEPDGLGSVEWPEVFLLAHSVLLTPRRTFPAQITRACQRGRAQANVVAS
jgi:hypothetical protein